MLIEKIRSFLWRILGVDYQQTLKVHDYVFLKNDKSTTLGYKTYDNGALVWRWTDAELKIGNYCSIANNVSFIVDEGYHNASSITSFTLISSLFKEESILPNTTLKSDFIKQIKQRKGITLGHDVWVGMGSYIMPGVKIGNGVTIGANTIVTKDIPDYSVVVGSPGKIIKLKHDDRQIQKLNEIAWWNWEEKEIKDRILDFYELNINQFIDKYHD